jgi:hypothetical protein
VVSKNQDPNAVLNALKQITASKTQKRKSVSSNVGKPASGDSWLTGNLLKQLDENPYRKPGTFFPKGPQSSTNQELFDAISTIRQGEGAMGILTAADTPKRAVISSIREVVDALDFKDETKASFSDWKKQTLDREFGYGRAFPISSSNVVGRWAGRTVGLVGDLLFDPVNWATLGGAIPVRATIKMTAKEFADAAATGAARKYVVKKVLDDGSVLINARSAIGKNVIGRDGRNALARFSKQRLTALRNESVSGYENLTDDMITQIYGKISARGKSELFDNPNIPKDFAQSIGVRSPGVYYFGSRIKVPLTGPIGELTEESLTELRLFLSNTKGGKAFRRVATPGGVGRISRFGTQEVDKEGKIVVRNAIKDARVNLADGSLIEPEEIRRAMIVVEGHDIGRLRNTVHVENESINFAPLVDELAAVEGGHKYLDMIPRADLEGMVPYDPDASIALRVRDYMDSLWKKVNDRGAEVGAAPIPYREGYFTHLETAEAQRLRLKIGDDAFEDLISPANKAERLSNRAQRRNVFRRRTLEDGQDFFGVKLIESGPDANMDVDSLNRIFREKGGFDFDLFQNDTAAVLAEYLHQFADQMAWYDTLEYITKNYPEYLGFGETLAKISTSYERQIMVDAPNQAFNQLQNAIRSHSIFLEDALNSVRSELLQKFQSFEAMLKSLEDGTISQKTLDDLFESLNEQIAIADGLEAEYRSMLSTVSSSMENLDGVGGFDLFFQNSNVLSAKFDEIKKLAETIKATSKTDPKYNEMISDLYKQVENYEAAVSTFSRNLEFASVVSDVFPALSDIGKYGASEQYDIFTKIIDEIGGVNPASAARGRAEGFGPKNARRFGWKESDVVAVSRVTQEDVRSILGDVRSGLVPEKTGDAMSAKIALLSKYVKSIIVENEFLGGDTVSAFLRDERTGLRASKSAGPLDKNIRVNKETLYGQYAKAVESLKAGDVKPMENLIIQQQALSQIYKWEEMFAPFGITIGDDVIDEIVQREAREYAIIALRNNDDKRFAELTSGDFGRQDGTGPLGTHRMIERKRVIAEENIKQSKWRIPMKLSEKKVSPEQARKIDKDVFLRRMSPEQRSIWGRVRAENTKLIEYTQKRIEELKQLMLKPDQQAVSQEAVWDSAENSFGNVIRFLDSGELFGIVNDSATGNFVLYNDLINYLHDIAREHPLMSDNWPAFLETVTKNIEEFAILNQYTNPTSKLYGQQKFELRQAITDALLSESANSKVIYFSSVRSQDDSVVAEMLRLTKLQVSAQETLNNPQEYFQRGVGRIELDARNNRLRPTPRPLDEGGMVVDARTGELVAPTKSELDIKLAEYRNSEQHDIAFGVQTNVNSAYVLAYLNLDKMPAEYMPGGISFTTEEWDKIVNGDFIETGSGKFHTFVTALRRDREIYLESSYLGDDVSDVKLLEGFVDFVIANFRDTDAVVLSDEVIKFRRKSLDRAFKRSEHWAWLEDFSTLEQRKFAEAYVRDSADEVRQLDLLTNTVNQIEELAAKQVTDTAEYGPNARARLSEAINDLLKNKGNVKRVNKAETKLARDNEGVLETTFLGRLGEGKEVANIESLPIKGIDNVDITVLARNKRAGETIDLYLSAPNIEKTIEQLQQEIDILRRLDDSKVDTPYTTGKSRKRLILDREKEISKRVGNADLTLTPRDIGLASERVPDNYSPSVAEGIAEDARTTASRRTASSVAGNRTGSDFDPDIQEIVDIEKVRESIVRGTPPEMVAVPKEQFPASTTVDADGLKSLETQLNDLLVAPRTKAANEAKGAAEQARQLANRMQDAYDQTASLARIDPAVVADLKNQIDQLSKLIDESRIPVKPTVRSSAVYGPSATRADRINVTRDYRPGSDLWNKHEEATAFLEYANEVLSVLGMKANGEFDMLDSVLRAGVASELEMHRALLGMTRAEEERALLQGIQGMIDGGGRLLPDGRVRLPDGRIVDGVPESAVYTAGREVRENFELFSEFFPDLYASPEMAELLRNASRFEDPVFVRKMAYYIGPYTKVFKAFAVMTPGFHVRNGLANAIQLALAGAEMDNVIQGSRMYYSWLKAKKAGSTWDEFMKTLDPNMAEVMNIARDGSIGSGGGIYSEVIKEAIGGKLEKLWLVRKNYALGQASDNYSRFILAYDSALKGNDAVTAAARVKRFFFDYEDLSTLDKVMKQIIPFWVFYSRNMHVQITNMWLNPKPYLIYNNVKDNISDREKPLPPFVRQMGGFKLPVGKGLYAMPDFGFTRIEQELSDLTNPKRLLNKVNPVFSVPIEQIMGRDAFTEKEFTGTQDRLLNALRSVAPPASQVDRLILNDNPMSQLNAWLGYLGSPVRKYN